MGGCRSRSPSRRSRRGDAGPVGCAARPGLPLFEVGRQIGVSAKGVTGLKKTSATRPRRSGIWLALVALAVRLHVCLPMLAFTNHRGPPLGTQSYGFNGAAITTMTTHRGPSITPPPTQAEVRTASTAPAQHGPSTAAERRTVRTDPEGPALGADDSSGPPESHVGHTLRSVLIAFIDRADEATDVAAILVAHRRPARHRLAGGRSSGICRCRRRFLGASPEDQRCQQPS